MSAPADLGSARWHIRLLTGTADTPCTFQTFDDLPTKDPSKARIVHGSLTACWDRLVAASSSGCGVFITVNQTDGAGRKSENITKVRALFIDGDNMAMPAFSLQPSFTMQRDDTHWHAYWTLTDGELASFTEDQKRLIDYYGSDKAVKDLPRVMRLAGFPHQKDPANIGVYRIAVGSGKAYTRDEATAAHPAQHAEDAQIKASEDATNRSASDMAERARAYVSRIHSIQGQDGTASMMTVVRALASKFMLSDSDLWPVLQAWNASNSTPPWTDQELTRALATVRKTAATCAPLSDSGPSKAGAEADNGTEAAIAEALAGSDLNRKLLHATGQTTGWNAWDGRRWLPSPDRCPLALQAAIRHIIATGLESRVIDAKSISRLESASGMRGIGSLLSAWPSMRLPDEVDLPGTLAMPSHVIELHGGERLAHDPARMITRCTAVNPGPANDRWRPIEDHLRDCLGGSYNAIHRFLGSALLGRGADRKLVWLHGPGGDGKSTFAKLLRYALGDYLCVVPAEVFQASSRGAHLHELGSGLAGSRLALALEVSGTLDWDRLKGISGGDEQVSKRLYGRAYTCARPPCLLIVSQKPPTPPDRASAERIIIGHMRPPVDPDERIMAILKDGGPERDALAGACLSWLLKGCADYLQHGLGPVQTAARSGAGLEAWWERGVDEGRIIAGKGWSPLADLVADLAAFLAPSGDAMPRDNEVSSFLRERVEWKRTTLARLYRAVVQ